MSTTAFPVAETEKEIASDARIYRKKNDISDSLPSWQVNSREIDFISTCARELLFDSEHPNYIRQNFSRLFSNCECVCSVVNS